MNGAHHRKKINQINDDHPFTRACACTKRVIFICSLNPCKFFHRYQNNLLTPAQRSAIVHTSTRQNTRLALSQHRFYKWVISPASCDRRRQGNHTTEVHTGVHIMFNITQAILKASIKHTMEWYRAGILTAGEVRLRLDRINRNLHGEN